MFKPTTTKLIMAKLKMAKPIKNQNKYYEKINMIKLIMVQLTIFK